MVLQEDRCTEKMVLSRERPRKHERSIGRPPERWLDDIKAKVMKCKHQLIRLNESENSRRGLCPGCKQTVEEEKEDDIFMPKYVNFISRCIEVYILKM